MRQAAADDIHLLLFSCRSVLKQSMERTGAQESYPVNEIVIEAPQKQNRQRGMVERAFDELRLSDELR